MQKYLAGYWTRSTIISLYAHKTIDSESRQNRLREELKCSIINNLNKRAGIKQRHRIYFGMYKVTGAEITMFFFGHISNRAVHITHSLTSSLNIPLPCSRLYAMKRLSVREKKAKIKTFPVNSEMGDGWKQHEINKLAQKSLTITMYSCNMESHLMQQQKTRTTLTQYVIIPYFLFWWVAIVILIWPLSI